MAIWQHYRRVLCIFSLRMRRNGYLGASGQKSDPRHSLQRPQFPIRQMYFHYRVTFSGYIPSFCATALHDFWPFDLECSVFNATHVLLLMCNPHTNFYYPITIGYWVTITEYLITFPWSETVTAYAPCHVAYNRGKGGGAKIVHILKFLTPICLFTLSLSGR